jgi:hypothetical protein
MTSLNVEGIVLIVLVLLKTMVLKDGQATGADVRYEILDTSRNSVENLGRLLNTSAGDSVVMEGDNVRNWTFVMTLVKVAGIVLIVLVFLKTMVLKDGQPVGADVRYDTLDTSRYSVVNLRRLLNTLATLSDVMEGDIVMETRLMGYVVIRGLTL